jgi:hypothetical protein
MTMMTEFTRELKMKMMKAVGIFFFSNQNFCMITGEYRLMTSAHVTRGSFIGPSQKHISPYLEPLQGTR